MDGFIFFLLYHKGGDGGEMGELSKSRRYGFFTVHTLLLVDLVYMLLVGEMCAFLEKCFDLDSWNVSKRFVQQPAAGSRDRVATQLRRFPEFVFCMAKKKTWALIKKMIADCIFFSPQITERTWKIMKTPSRLTCVCPADWRWEPRASSKSTLTLWRIEICPRLCWRTLPKPGDLVGEMWWVLFGMLTCQVKNHGSPEHKKFWRE